MHDAEKKEPDREAIKIHIAILIGISTYDKPEQNLPSAVRDVELLRYCLNGYYDEIYTITSKGASEIFDKDRHSEVLSASDTRNRVEAIFQQICEKYSMAPTLFWVHFSGHGSDDEKEQWIFEHPGDANPGEERVYFSAKFVMDVARQYTRRLFMTIDACRNGDRVSRTANEAPEGIYCLEPEMPDSLVEIDPRLIEGYCYFGACAPGRKTHESINAEIGPFTASIVEAVREGLEGKGDVTVGQMIAKFQRDSLLPSTSHGDNMFDQALLVRWRPSILWDTVFVGTEADLNNLQFKLRELPSTNKCFHNYQYLPGLAKRPWPQMRVGAPLWIFWSCPVATVGIMFLLKHERSTAADFVHYINMIMKNNPATTIILDCRLTEKDVQYLHELLDYKVRFVYWKDNFHNRNEQNSLFKHIKFDNELNIPAIDSIDQIAQLGPGNSEKPNVTSENSKIVIENLLKQGAFVPFEVLEATDVHTVCLERSSRKVSKILIIGSGEDAWEAFFQYTVAALSRNIDLVAIFGTSFTAIKDVLTDAINQMIARPHDLTICFCGRFEVGLNNHYPLMQVKDQLFNFIEGIYDKIGQHDEIKRYDKAIEVCVFDSGYGLQDLASNADAFVVIPNPYVFTTRILDLQRHSNSVLPFALLSNAGRNGNHQAEIKSFFY